MMCKLRLSDILLLTYRRSGLRGFFALHRFWSRISGSPYIRVRSVHGAVFEILPTGYVEKFLIHHGFYESEVFAALNSHLGDGGVLWDIGANMGLHAVTAKLKQPAATVVAFEPVQVLRSRIQANAALNDVRITTAEEALSNISGPRNLYVPEGNPSGLASLKTPHAKKWKAVPVECRRADELIQSGVYAPPTVVKLDVEGAEFEVLQGFGSCLLEPSLRAVVFEGAPGLENRSNADPVADILREAGFTLHQLKRNEPTEHLLQNYVASR
jgi:FkbM family methyltransferase